MFDFTDFSTDKRREGETPITADQLESLAATLREEVARLFGDGSDAEGDGSVEGDGGSESDEMK